MAEIILEAGEWIYRMFIMLIVAAVAIFIVGSAVNIDLNTHDLQEQLLLSRILYSADSIWYMDNDILYPGVVDMSKFTPEQMAQSFQYKANYGGAKLSLTVPRQIGATYAEIYINEPTFKHFETQNQAGLGGNLHHYSYPVVVRTGNKEENGKLMITIATPTIT